MPESEDMRPRWPMGGMDRRTEGRKDGWTGLFLERAREPVALYFAVGLSGFAGSEPGWLSQN